MGTSLKLLILIFGMTFAGSVIYLLVKKRISERNSLLWIFGVICTFTLSVFPRLLDIIARFVGIEYPPTLLFLLSILILLLICLYHSIQISVMNDRLKQLTQQVALNSIKEEDEGGNG